MRLLKLGEDVPERVVRRRIGGVELSCRVEKGRVGKSGSSGYWSYYYRAPMRWGRDGLNCRHGGGVDGGGGQ